MISFLNRFSFVMLLGTLLLSPTLLLAQEAAADDQEPAKEEPAPKKDEATPRVLYTCIMMCGGVTSDSEKVGFTTYPMVATALSRARALNKLAVKCDNAMPLSGFELKISGHLNTVLTYEISKKTIPFISCDSTAL